MARTNGSKGIGSKGGKKRGRRGGDKRVSKSARGSDTQDGILGALVLEIWSAVESGGSGGREGLSGMAEVLLRDGKVVFEVLKEVIAGSETKDELRGAMGVMYGGGMVAEPAARGGCEILDAACKMKDAFADETFAAMDVVEKLLGLCDDRKDAMDVMDALVGKCETTAEHAAARCLAMWKPEADEMDGVFDEWAIERAMEGQGAALAEGAEMMDEERRRGVVVLALDAMIGDDGRRGAGAMDALLVSCGGEFYGRGVATKSVMERLIDLSALSGLGGLGSRGGVASSVGLEVLGRVARADAGRATASGIMYYAVKGGFVRALGVLVGAGVSQNTRTFRFDETVAHKAVMNAEAGSAMLEVLAWNKEEFAWSMKQRSSGGYTPLDVAVRSGMGAELVRKVVELMVLTAAPVEGRTLKLAVERGSAEVFCALVDGGQPVTFEGAMHGVAGRSVEFIDAVASIMGRGGAGARVRMLAGMKELDEGGRTALGVAIATEAGEAVNAAVWMEETDDGIVELRETIRARTRSDAAMGLLFAVDDERVYFSGGELAEAIGGMKDGAATRLLEAAVRAGYEGGSVARGAILGAAMKGQSGAVRYLASMSEWETLVEKVGGARTVISYVAEKCDEETLRAVHGRIAAGARAKMARVDELAGKAREFRDECEAEQICGEALGELVGGFESGKRAIERKASLADSGAFEAVATKVASCGSRAGGLVGLGGLGVMGLVAEDVETVRKFEFLVSIGASAGKYTSETMRGPYFVSAFASKEVLASVDEALLMEFVLQFCKVAREGCAFSGAAGRVVAVDRQALDLGAFLGGRGGMAGVSQDRLRLGGEERVAYGAGTVMEAMGALWAQLSAASAGVFLEGGRTPAFGLVPRPDAEAAKLELLGWVIASGVRGNYTLGGAGVSPPVLSWMLGMAADGARDLVGLSGAGSCDASLWMAGVEMEVEDWVEAMGPVGGLLDGAALSGMMGSVVVTAESFGALAEHAANMIREKLSAALGSLRRGFDAGLCGTVRTEGRAMIGAVMDAGPCEGVSGVSRVSRVSLRMNGPRSIDTREWRAQTTYEGYTASSGTIEMFWRQVDELEMGDKLLVLKFWTGRSAPAASGAHAGGFKIRLLGRGVGGDRLIPESHTCFSELCLSEYGADETAELRRHVGVIIEHANEMANV